MEIVSRDVEVMQWILEQKFMTREQIRNVFWKDESKKSTEEYRRLYEMEGAGLLRRSKRSFYRQVLYLITGKGVRQLQVLGQCHGLGELYDVDSAQIKHDIAVTDLRIVFRALGFNEWLSERVLAKRNDLRTLPDGMIHHRGRCIAIEYEATVKSKRRYREIFLDYELDNQVDKVLYVVETDEMVVNVGRQEICDKAHFTTLRNIQEHQLDAQLKGMNGFCSLQAFIGGTS